MLQGRASFKNPGTLEVSTPDGRELVLSADRVLIATGASPAIPTIPGLKQSPYWTSTEALLADTEPEHLIVLGGSAVGLELAQAFLHLGSRVTVVELLTLLPRMDFDIGAGLKTILEAEGARVLTNAQAKSVAFDGARFALDVGGESISGDRLLVAAACCLGVSAALSALTAIGAGFLINDAILIPLFLAFVSLSLWLLYRSARSHADLRPFRVGLGGGIAAFAGLWIAPLVVIAGLAVCVGASLWDFVLLRAGRRPGRNLSNAA